MQNKQKGITLIALIITIIVMLILVGVTVNIAFNGGLFDTTKEATFKTEISQMQEALQVKKTIVIAQNGGELLDLIGTNTFELISNTTIDLDIPEKLKEKYGSKIGIGKKAEEEVNLFYDVNSDLTETERQWLQDIQILPWEITKEELALSYMIIDNKIALLIECEETEKEERAKAVIETMMSTDFTSSDDAIIALASYYSTQAGGTAITDINTAVSFINTNILNVGDAFTTKGQTLSALLVFSGIITVNGNPYDPMVTGYLIDEEINKENTATIIIDSKELTVDIPMINRVGLYVKHDDGYDSDSDGQTDDELYMVLYDDAENGLQIVSLDALHEVVLGDANDVEKTLDDFNNAVTTLNSECTRYTNNKSYIKRARSIGSNPKTPDLVEKFSSDILRQFDEKYGTSYNGQMNMQTNKQDRKRLWDLEILFTGSNYWIASTDLGTDSSAELQAYLSIDICREDVENKGYHGIMVLCFNVNYGVDANWTEYYDGTKIRPVIILQDDVEFSGSGTEIDPYVVSNYS